MEYKAIRALLKDHVNSNGRQALQSWAGGLSMTPKGGCDSFVIDYCDGQETKPTHYKSMNGNRVSWLSYGRHLNRALGSLE